MAAGHYSTKEKQSAYSRWRTLIPVLYDWFCHHHLVWPSLSCRWGPTVEEHRFKVKQRVYLSEQTDGSVPNTLVVATVEVVRPRVAAAEHITAFQPESRSPLVRKTKTIIHPGEVNRIRELPQAPHIVATHTDSPEVLIWNVDTQPARGFKEKEKGVREGPSQPDLVLKGHTSNAEFALALSPAAPLVLSGGQDACVALWNLGDHITGLQNASLRGSPAGNASPPGGTPKVGTALQARALYKGHVDTVEDVQFRPSSAHEFCSVADDSQLLLWDARAGTEPVTAVQKAHDADLHCVDWNPHDENLLLTGSADAAVKLFDRRQLATKGESAAVHTFEGHGDAVLCVQWCPDRASVFGSCAEDKVVNVWDSAQVGAAAQSERDTSGAPAGLMFKHVGHRDKVVDFHWNPADPWTVVSVSDDVGTAGGSSLQLWRINDLIHRPQEEAMAELEKHRSYILDKADS